MTDKQIDRNNQVEVGLNIAKELLELHKIFEDEVEKNPYVIQTDFIKYKLFYFYQRADWLNVCFKLLEQQLKAKEQECEEWKEEIKKHNDDMFKNPPEKRFYCKGCTLPYISKKLKTENDNLKETFDDLFKVQYKLADTNKKLRQCLTEIKEIAERGFKHSQCNCGAKADLDLILQKSANMRWNDETN